MSSTTTYSCDVKGDNHSTLILKDESVPVVFTTEQTEGRSIKPRKITMKKIDICSDCHEFMIDTRQMLTASGAMGYNDYWFNNPEAGK